MGSWKQEIDVKLPFPEKSFKIGLAYQHLAITPPKRRPHLLLPKETSTHACMLMSSPLKALGYHILKAIYKMDNFNNTKFAKKYMHILSKSIC